MNKKTSHGITFENFPRETILKMIDRGCVVSECAAVYKIPLASFYKLSKRHGIHFPKARSLNGGRILSFRGLYRCTGCDRIRPLDEKTKRKSASRKCVLCEAKRFTRRIESIVGRMNVCVSAARKRAKGSGLDFDITVECVINLWKSQDGKCAYSGAEMSLLRGSRSIIGSTVSIDRIDSSRGYTKDNVVLCCNIVNRMKLNMSVEDFKHWCQLIVNHNPVSAAPEKELSVTTASLS